MRQMLGMIEAVIMLLAGAAALNLAAAMGTPSIRMARSFKAGVRLPERLGPRKLDRRNRASE